MEAKMESVRRCVIGWRERVEQLYFVGSGILV